MRKPVTDNRSPENSQMVTKVTVEAGGQQHVVLGTFDKSASPRGFGIYLSPDPAEDAIVSQITKLDKSKKSREFVLFIANYGEVDVVAEVRLL